MKLVKKAKKGFTIVELVIVIGVIGILSAILIPTFVNVTKNAEEAALQANLAQGYSMYAAEMADGYVDGYKDSSDKAIKIAQEDQFHVTLQFDGSFYNFDGDKWNTTGVTTPTAKVVTTDAASPEKLAADLSTFNKVTVWVKVAA